MGRGLMGSITIAMATRVGAAVATAAAPARASPTLSAAMASRIKWYFMRCDVLADAVEGRQAGLLSFGRRPHNALSRHVLMRVLIGE